MKVLSITFSPYREGDSIFGEGGKNLIFQSMTELLTYISSFSFRDEVIFDIFDKHTFDRLFPEANFD